MRRSRTSSHPFSIAGRRAAGGKRLFGEGTVPTTMQLPSTEVTSAGVVVATYLPKGAPVLQTIAIEDGKEVIV